MANYRAEDFNVLIKGDSILLQEKHVPMLYTGNILISGLQYPITPGSVQRFIDKSITWHHEKLVPVMDMVMHYRNKGTVPSGSSSNNDEAFEECLKDIIKYVLNGGDCADYEYTHTLHDDRAIHLVPAGKLCKEWLDIAR